MEISQHPARDDLGACRTIDRAMKCASNHQQRCFQAFDYLFEEDVRFVKLIVKVDVRLAELKVVYIVLFG